MTSQDVITHPAVWPSVARLLATSCIYIFHYLGLIGKDGYRLDFFAILVFCFLSGYLLHISKRSKFAWAIKHYIGIMIPYWLIIFPVIIVNYLFQYKKISLASQIITILGGNLFLNNPLYVVAWYVTFILLLYFYAIVESYFKSWQVFICMIIGSLLFFTLLGRGYYFIAFIAGLRLSALHPARSPKSINDSGRLIANALFIIQRYCYLFFLIHGAVLIFFVEKTAVSAINLFMISLIVSLILSVSVYAISKPLEIFLTRKTLKLTENITSQFSAV